MERHAGIDMHLPEDWSAIREEAQFQFKLLDMMADSRKIVGDFNVNGIEEVKPRRKKKSKSNKKMR